MIERIETIPIDGPIRRAGVTGSSLRLRRAWPRGDDHLLLEFADADGRILPGQWMADADGLERVARQTGDVSGIAPIMAATGAGPVLLQPGGADRRLPGLAALLRDADATLLSHRPERRAVVRLQGAAAAAPRYAKIVRPERAAALAASIESLAAAAAGTLRVPRLLELDETGGVVVTSALPGATLFDIGPDRLPTASAAAGAAVRTLHALTLPGAARHDAETEAAVLRSWVGRASAFLPSHAGPLGDALAAVLEALAAAGAGPEVLLHRDLYDKQMLAAVDGTVGLIDLDTVAVGEPALDIANAAAHFELRALQGRITTSTAALAVEAFRRGYDAELPAARLAAYRRSTWLRLACVYAFRPPWRDLVDTLRQLALEPDGTRPHPAVARGPRPVRPSSKTEEEITR